MNDCTCGHPWDHHATLITGSVALRERPWPCRTNCVTGGVGCACADYTPSAAETRQPEWRELVEAVLLTHRNSLLECETTHPVEYAATQARFSEYRAALEAWCGNAEAGLSDLDAQCEAVGAENAALKARVEELAERNAKHVLNRIEIEGQFADLRSTQRTGVEQAAVELAERVAWVNGNPASRNRCPEHERGYHELVEAYERAREAAKGTT